MSSAEEKAARIVKLAERFALSPRLTFEGTTDPYPKDLMLSVFSAGVHGFDSWRWDVFDTRAKTNLSNAGLQPSLFEGV